MTRKDYVVIAKAFSVTRPATATESHYQWLCDLHTIADVLATDNPRFDRERFVSACQAV